MNDQCIKADAAGFEGYAAKWWRIRIEGQPLLLAALLHPIRVQVYFHLFPFCVTFAYRTE